MRSFLSYLERDEVRMTGKDAALANGLREDAKYRLAYARKEVVSESSAKIVLENLYEAIRAEAEAFLAMKGYRSYSHVATLAFLKEEKLLKEADITYLDLLRELRHKSRYYGERISVAEAKRALAAVPPLLAALEKAYKNLYKEKT